MSLLTNRNNLRSRLKIDPSGKIWSDSTLNNYLNEGQREVINDPDANWDFQETIGYLVPDDKGLAEILEQNDDNPENFFSKRVQTISDMFASNGSHLDLTTMPEFNNSNGTAPSRYNRYAERLFLNVGYDSSATYTTLHNMNTFDGNGTWTAEDAETINVATDASTYKEGSGSVSFDIDVSGTVNNKAGIVNTTMTAVDISSIVLNQAAIIMWVYLPSVGNFEGFNIYFGSSASDNYKVRSYKTDAQGLAYQDGWNRIVIPTVRREQTGTPVVSAITSLMVELLYNTNQEDMASCRVDNIQIVDKYLRYLYTLTSVDMREDLIESVIPSQYQAVYELYAEYKAWSILSGREEKAQLAFQEYKRFLNRMKRELLYTSLSDFCMKFTK